ncbi:MAG: hypothetical protein ABI806_06765 [Candidatus Solibacter sp.]
MSNETFQIIIATAVGLAIVSIIVQALTMLALYRSARQMATRLAPFLKRTREIITVEKESIRRIEIAIDKTQLSVDILARVAPRIAVLVARVENVAAHAMQLSAPIAALQRDAILAGTAAHFLSLEMRPRLVSLGHETSALAGAADTQFRRVVRVFRDSLTHLGHLVQVVAAK